MPSVQWHDQARDAEVIWSSNSIVAPQSSRALLFKCAGVNYAVAAEHVLEVIEHPVVTGLAAAPVWFSGLAVYKARPVPVIDVGRYFELSSDESTYKGSAQKAQPSRCIVVQLAGSNYLLSADTVLNLAELPEDRDNFSTESGKASDVAEHRAIKYVCHTRIN